MNSVEVVCLNCCKVYKEEEVWVYTDELGTHAVCSGCEASFDVEDEIYSDGNNKEE